MEKNKLPFSTAKHRSLDVYLDSPSPSLLLRPLRNTDEQKIPRVPLLRPLGDKTNYAQHEQELGKHTWSNEPPLALPPLPASSTWRMSEAPKTDTTAFDPFDASHIFTPQYPDQVDSMKPPSILDTQPSRHLCISNLEPYQDTRSLVQVLEQAGDIKVVHPDFLYSSGTLMISYYDLRHASRGYTDLRAFALQYSLHVQITFATEADVAQMFNTNAQSQDSVFVALYGAVERIETFNFMGLLESFGAIRDVMDIEFSSGRKVALVEFHDERVAARVQSNLHDKVFQDVAVQIRPCITQPVLEQQPAIEQVWPVRCDLPSPCPFSLGQSSRDAAVDMSRSRMPGTSFSTPSLSSSSRFSTVVGHPVAMDVDYNMSFSCRDSPLQMPPFSCDATGLSNNSSSLFAHDPLAAVPLYSDLTVKPSASTPTTLRYKSPLLQGQRSLKDSEMAQIPECEYASGSGVIEPSSMVLSIDGIDQSDNTLDIDRVIQGKDTRTTFMIRNIPNKYTQQMLIECINATHKGTYDFLYLRIDFKNKCNVGYAFINFIDVKSVISFAQERVGKRWNRFNSEKRCSLSYANIQGKEALIEKFRNSNVMEEDETYRPRVFYSSGQGQGQEEPFPLPTISAETRKQRQHLRQRRDGLGSGGNSNSGRGSGSGNSALLKLCR